MFLNYAIMKHGKLLPLLRNQVIKIMNKIIYLVSFALFLCLFLSGCVAREIDMFENRTINNLKEKAAT